MNLIKKFFIFDMILIFLFATNSIAYSNNINKLNEEKNEIKNKTNELKEQLNSVTGEKKSVQSQIESLDNQLEIVQKQVDNLTEQLNLTKEQLKNSEVELEEAKQVKEKQYETLKSRLRFMYENGSSGYLEFLLNAKKLTDFFKRVEYINSIIEYDETLLEKYAKTEENIEKKVEEIKTQKNNIEILTKEQQKKQEILNKSILEKEKMVKELASKESTYLEQISDLERESKEITELIKKAQAKKINSTGSSNNKIYNISEGQLAYPVPAYRGYAPNDTYGSRVNPISKKSEVHTGLDLKATLGTDVVSAEDGIVIFAGTRGGYGKTVIVDHGNSLTTLYAHNSSLTVKTGQTVKRGQVIAKAGSTGYSTGVHLHFEVRVNGKHVNPQPYIKN